MATQVKDKTFALRCFIDGKRKRSDSLTREEARCFLITATHMARYLRCEYKVTCRKT